MITKEEIKIEAKKNLDFVKTCYEEQNYFDLMFLVKAKEQGKIVTTAVGFEDPSMIDDRYNRIFDIGVMWGIKKMKKEVDDIEAVFMMSEAWLSMGPISDKKVLRPSLDPKRVEVIISTALSKNGDGAYEVYEIKKKWNDGGVTVEFTDIKDNPIMKENTKDTKEGDIRSTNPLLDEFWRAVNLMAEFEKTLPVALKSHVLESDTDELFRTFINQLNRIRNK